MSDWVKRYYNDHAAQEWNRLDDVQCKIKFASGGMRPVLEKLSADDPETYASVVQFSAETCELSQYRDTTDHLHIVVRK